MSVENKGAEEKFVERAIRKLPKNIISTVGCALPYAAGAGAVVDVAMVPYTLYECSKDEKCHHDVGTYPSAVAADEFAVSTYGVSTSTARGVK